MADMPGVRSARKEIVAVKKELAALNAILEILADDLQEPANTRGSYPDGVVERIVEIGKHCQEVITDIGECVGLEADREGEQSRVVWAASGKAKVERLRGELGAHKSTLSVTLNLVSVNPQSNYVLEDLNSDAETLCGETEDLPGSGDSTPRRANKNAGVSERQGVGPLIQVPKSAKRRPSSIFGRLSLRGIFTGHGRLTHSRVGSDAGDGDSVSEGIVATEIAPRNKREQFGSGMETGRAERYQAPQTEDLAPIIIKNHQGQGYVIPYAVGKNWRDMKTAIEQAYGSFAWDPARQGYDLVGPKGHIILPIAWESVVKPGLEVRLKRWGYPDP